MPGNWEGSDRGERLPANWPDIVRQIKARDHGRCRWTLPSGVRCPRPGTQVDHVQNGDNHAEWNLRLLCEDHHNHKSSKEGLRARQQLKRAGRRPAERHPGDR